MVLSNHASNFRKLWNNIGLSSRLLVNMARGAMPPTIALAIYQASSIAEDFQTVGYLIAVVAILSPSVQPRVAFVKSMIVTTLLTLVGACISLLAGYCTIQARANTTPAGGKLSEYNSSASVVSGVWLFFNIWIANTFRAYRPQFTPSVILYSIFTEISIMINSRAATMQEVVYFEKTFLEIFFLGHALATGVNLFVFPTSSRSVAFGDIREYLTGAQQVLQAEAAYVQSFEQSDILNPQPPDIHHQHTEEGAFQDLKARHEPLRIRQTPEAEDLKAALDSLSRNHAKLRADLNLAKQDIAWARLTPEHLEEMFRNLRNLILPLRGLSVLISIVQRLAEWRGWVVFEGTQTRKYNAWQYESNHSLEDDYRDRREWRTIFRNFREPVDELSKDMQGALKHVSAVLGLDEESIFSRTRKCDPDIEIRNEMEPGSPSFGEYYATKTLSYHKTKGSVLSNWILSKGFENGAADGSNDARRLSKIPTALEQNDEEQLFVILYMQHLFHGIADAILALVKFADSHSLTDHSTRKRFIYPGRRRTMKLIRNFLKEVDTNDDVNVGDSRIASSHIVNMGDSQGKRHPEHLPPKNYWEVFGNGVRQVSHFLASPQSNFGFRVACAILTIAIVGLIQPTQDFFFNQRCVWAMIIIAFCMTPTSGQTLSGLVFRMIGTFLAVVIGILNWYMVDGHAAGVLVFFFIFTFIEFYFIIKYPQYVGIFKVTLITRSIVTGYALQTQKTGIQAPPATSANHYPIYLIGPYRLATTVVGVFVAFVWTVFPAPVTARSVLRKKLGQSLFLLGNYYSCMHATVSAWASGSLGDVSNKESAGRRLEKARNKIFAKELILLASLREHSALSKYEPSVGGQFPKKLYDKIIAEADVILSHMNLVIYATTTSFPGSTNVGARTVTLEGSAILPAVPTDWLKSLSTLFSSAGFASYNIATLLALLASSMTNSQPLPPYLEPPKPYHLARQMNRVDPELLSVRHAEDPGYSAFAVIEVSCTMIAEGLGRLLGHVKELVGEVDFGNGLLGIDNGKDGKVD